MPMEHLPDEVLGLILKLAADAPAHPAAPPTPITAGRLNRRWRSVALSYPELWTNIRISHRPRSLRWATIAVARSGSLPLDISISVEGYARECLPLERIFRVLGSHLRRWRTVAFRGWSCHMDMFHQFLASAGQEATSGIESLNLSNTEEIACGYYESPIATMPDLTGLGLPNLRALKLENFSFTAPMVKAHLLRALDLDFSGRDEEVEATLRPLLESNTSQLNTLVLREIQYWPRTQHRPIEAHSLRSWAVNLYSSNWGHSSGGIEPLKRIVGIFDMPNLERLEILGGFTGEKSEEKEVEGWQAPLLPCLQSLRLQHICFSRAHLALIQFVSRGITHLELIDTHGHGYLLHSDLQWRHLRDITIEPGDADAFVPWVARFVEMQSRSGTPTESSDIILRLLHPRKILVNPRTRAPSMRWLCDGPSHTFFDNICPSDRGFYVGADNGPADFERVRHPEWCGCRHWDTPDGTCSCNDESFLRTMREEQWLEDEIAEAFASTGEILRGKWLCQGKRDQRRSGPREGRSKGRRFRGEGRKHDLGKDFWLT